MRRWQKAAVLVGIGIAAIALGNCSRLAPRPAHGVRWIAHRGVHQTFSLEGVGNDTCTASRVDPIVHDLIENTLPSMQAAFDAHASAVELDLHSTSDGQLAVFHDATLDCRTDGHGAPEDHPLAELRRLDVGWGYTADGGATWPLRGKGVGGMPALVDVLDAFPDHGLILHFKTDDPVDGDRLADVLAGRPGLDRIWVYGGGRPVARMAERLPAVRGFDAGRTKACLGRYLALGWTGYVPPACRDTVVSVPINVAPWLWGWPRRFERRMARARSEVVVMGPWTGGPGDGVDDPATAALVPDDFGGWIWTNHIEALGR